MDPISKALERAKSDQQKRLDQPGTNSVRSWVKPSSVSAGTPKVDLNFQAVTIDPVALAERRVVAQGGDPYVKDRYRLLRTRISQKMQPNQWRSIGITSAGAREGKTLTATNLAYAVARESSSSVILVDADLRRPAVGPLLDIEPTYGICDYLRGEADLEQVVLRIEDQPNMLVIPGSREEQSSVQPELLGSQMLDNLFSSLRQIESEALVIVDLPPTLVGDDVLALAPKIDCMLLVVAEGQTDVDELSESARLLADYNLLGTVLNNSTEAHKSSSDYYGYYDSEAKTS